jgi:hypothetical protein
VPADVADVLGTVARHRVAGLPAAEPVVVDRETWRWVGPPLTRERLTGLAVLALVDGDLVLDPGDVEDLADRDRQVQAQALRAERLTLDLCAELDAAGLPHIVLKGPAFAHSLYPGPATRPFVDVDLLVPAHALATVVARCERGGATRLLPELRRGFDRRFAKSVTLRHPSGVDIDLHRTLTLGPLTHLVRIEDLWAEPDSTEVLPGRRIPTLHPDLAFLHACLHATTGEPTRWLTVRDVVETERHADLERCAEIARRWTATAVVVAAVASARERDFPTVDRLDPWAAGLEPTAAERRVGAAYSTPRHDSRRLVAAGVRYVRGPLAKLAFARALALPSGANRRGRHRSVGDQARRILRRAA